VNRDVKASLADLGKFDFVWVRFLLEYFREESRNIVRNVSEIVKPEGILCLIDLDHNSMNYYGMDATLESTIMGIMRELEREHNFDPNIGRKLYSFLYDEGYSNIDVRVTAHHLIFGKLKDQDSYNWMKKLEVLSEVIDYDFSEYKGGIEEFKERFQLSFTSHKRFIYTPLICCRGTKSL
jgi:SAM-dependent methyltransferase